MDPSLSSDPHRPQYSPFPQFPTSNNPFVSGPNLPFYGGNPVNQTAFNSHVSQPQTQTQTPPSQAAPPYSELIVEAIADLNEPEGSSKMAISRYIERSNPVLPTAHAALLAHHLKTLKNCGVLTMVKKSYKLAASTPPESVAVAAAAAAAGLVVPRSESPMSNASPLDPAAGSASQPMKRGRGRPPKPKPEGPQQQQQLVNVQPNAVELNGQPSWEQPPTQSVTESVKRGPGRPRKDGSAPIARVATGMGVIMKRRGRPPGRRAAGRQRKPLSVSSTASVFPYVANGARRRGRPRRVDSGGVPTVAPAGGEAAAVAPGIKRGRGRPPKIGGVKNRLITKPKRGRGRPVGRPRKNTTWPVTAATGALESAYGELKAKLDLCNEKAKEILNVLQAGISNGDNQAVAEAAEKLEGLIPMLTVEPQAVEEVQPEEAAPQTEAEAEEPQGDGDGDGDVHGQEREGGEGEQAETQVQTDAEAMQEALF